MEFSLDKSTAVLRRTPSLLRTMLDGLDSEWTHTNEGGDSWSPFDVLGHLVHAERTDWIPRAQIILSQASDRTFPPFDRFAQFQESSGKTVTELLDEFAETRTASLLTLESWQPTSAQLALTGEHPAFGAVTLSQLLATWVVHDLGHVTQIARVMAKQYSDAVGPWQEYLSVLSRV